MRVEFFIPVDGNVVCVPLCMAHTWEGPECVTDEPTCLYASDGLHPGLFVRVYLHLCANPRPAFVHVIGMYFDCYSNAGPVSPLLYYGEGRVFAVDVPAPGISV